MPTRRTSDVIHVTMTDHRIARGPFDLNALVDLVEIVNRPITDVGLLEFGDPPEGDAGVLYRSLATARANRFVDAARQGIETSLQQSHYSNPTPYIDLARTQLQVGKYRDAEATLRRLLQSYKTLHVARTLLGTALMAQGQTAEAIEQLLISVNRQPDPEAFFNLGLGYLRSGEYERAEAAMENAIQLRPFMAAAWKYKGIILQSRQRFDAATDAFVRSLELEPLDTAVYAELIALLRATNNDDEADRYLELGLRVSHNPSTLESLR
jgi:tetratricopeptide (TPR) repeat protein